MQVNNHKALGEAIVVWINQIQLKGSLGEPIRSLLDLKDGVIFSQLLNGVDPSFFPLESTKQLVLNGRSNPLEVQQHLLDLQNKIISYRSNIQCKNDLFYVDVVQISNHASISQLLGYFEMVVKVLLSSHLKGEFIKPILQLTESDQEALMHFLKRFMENDDEEHQNESQEDWNASMISDHNFQQLIQKTEELENDNTQLQSVVGRQKEEIADLIQNTNYLQTLLDTKEAEYQTLMQQFYEERHNNREQQIIHQESETNTEEEDRLRQRIIQQEHKITELELTVEELKSKEKQLKVLRDENESYRKQLLEQNTLKHKLDTLRERREVEKDTHERIIQQKDKNIQNLQQNIKNILNDLSAEKEKSLDFEVQLQRSQALIVRLQQDKIRIEKDSEDKIKSLERLISLVKEEQHEQNEKIERHQSIEVNLEADLHKSENKQDFLQIEFYKDQNAKLEAKLKTLQQKVNKLELDAETNTNNNKEYELSLLKRENDMLREESKRNKEQLKKLQAANEELKRIEKKPQLIDFELELLKDLNAGLQQHAKQLNQTRVLKSK